MAHRCRSSIPPIIIIFTLKNWIIRFILETRQWWLFRSSAVHIMYFGGPRKTSLNNIPDDRYPMSDLTPGFDLEELQEPICLWSETKVFGQIIEFINWWSFKLFEFYVRIMSREIALFGLGNYGLWDFQWEKLRRDNKLSFNQMVVM